MSAVAPERGLLRRLWGRFRADAGPRPAGEADSVRDLAERVRADLRGRFERGERPALAEYLDRFPRLRAAHERVISLAYEEFCLREGVGEEPDPDSFCERYAPWRDSLASQLRYHRDFSRMVAAPPRPASFPPPGSRLLWFALERELGRGGSGRVFLARDASLGDKRVVLKLARDRSDEASLQGPLDHPHIVPVNLVEDDPETDLRVLCMPYLPGRPLAEVIEHAYGEGRPRRASALWEALAQPGEPPEAGAPEGWVGFPRRGRYADGAAWVALRLAEALGYAHDRGVAHRDIKPANILLTRRCGPMLLDFNLAHRPCDGAAAAKAATGGTLPYMAPEHLAAFLDPDRWGQVGPPADLYGLGLVLRELLTGRRPEVPDRSLPTDRAIAELLDWRVDAAPAPLHGEFPDVPHALDAILARCLAPEPAGRYASAGELAEDLRRYLDRRPLAVARNGSAKEELANWGRRHSIPMLGLAGVLAVGSASWLAAEAREQRVNRELDVAAGAVMRREFPEARRRYERLAEEEPDLAAPHEGLGTLALEESATKKGEPGRKLALLLESEGHYSRAIEVARAKESKRLPILFRHRANVRIALGNEAYDGGYRLTVKAGGRVDEAAAVELERSRERFRSAGADLEAAAKLQPDADIFLAQLYRAKVGLKLGMIASAFDAYDESLRRFREALGHAEEARRLAAGESAIVRGEVEKLRREIEPYYRAIKDQVDDDQRQRAGRPAP